MFISFDKIYNEYYKKIYNYTYTILLEHYAAEDVTEEIFFAVLENITKFDSNRGNFSTWLFTIAHNKIADYNRKARLSREVSVSEVPEVAAEDNTASTFESPINQQVKKSRRIANEF